MGTTDDACPTPPGATPPDDGCVVSGRLSRLQASGDSMVGTEQVLVNDWCEQFPSHTVDSLTFGPDGALYCCNNGGSRYVEGVSMGQGPHPDYKSGSIQRLDRATGAAKTLYTECDGHKLSAPNDLVFDKAGGMMSIGAIAVAPSNPAVVWVGTGEADNRQSSSWGDGVYKSTNGGLAWQKMGLEETRHVGKILIHPTDPNTVYVAAEGHLWGSNPERGVYKTTDGGKSWKKVLYKDEHTGAIDLAMDPKNSDVVFAAMYQHQRKGWGYNGGGPGSGIFRTSNGGTSWIELKNG